MRIRIILIFSLFLFSSCCVTRQCEVKKAEQKIYKLSQKYPELTKKIDTIFINDTIRIKNYSVDTSFNPFISYDTIIINKDKIRIKYIKKDSVVFISGECLGDTIYINKEIPVEKIVIREKTFGEIAKDYTMFIFAICAFLLVIRIFFKDVFKVFNIFK